MADMSEDVAMHEAPAAVAGTNRNRWTWATMAVTTLFVLVSLYYLATGSDVFVTGLALLGGLVFLYLLWMESRQNVLYVVWGGVLVTAAEMAYSLVTGASGDLAYEALYLLVPILAYLAYRELPAT